MARKKLINIHLNGELDSSILSGLTELGEIAVIHNGEDAILASRKNGNDEEPAEYAEFPSKKYIDGVVTDIESEIEASSEEIHNYVDSTFTPLGNSGDTYGDNETYHGLKDGIESLRSDVNDLAEDIADNFLPIGSGLDPKTAVTYNGVMKTIEEDEIVTAAALTKLKESAGFDENGESTLDGGIDLSTAIKQLSAFTSAIVEDLSDYYTKEEVDVITDGLNDEIQEVKDTYLPIGTTADTEDDKSYYGLVDAIQKDELAISQAMIKVKNSAGFNEDFETEGLDGKNLTEAILELSGRTVDLSGYYTSAQTNTAINNATTGKVDTTTLENNYYTSAETQAKISNAVSGKQDTISDLEDIRNNAASGAIAYVSAFMDAEYVSSAKTIVFKDVKGDILTQIDATDFIKDGMVNNVEIAQRSGVDCLVVTFNTDAGKEEIAIPLTNIFNPSNYYTKAETDTAIANASAETINVVENILEDYLPIGTTADTEDDKSYYGLVDAIEKDELALTQAILKVNETAGFDDNFEAPELSGKSVVEAILEVSGKTVDLSGYYTSAQTNTAINNATTGKVDTTTLENNYYTSAQTNTAINNAIAGKLGEVIVNGKTADTQDNSIELEGTDIKIGNEIAYSGITLSESGESVTDTVQALFTELINDEYTISSSLNDLNNRSNGLDERVTALENSSTEVEYHGEYSEGTLIGTLTIDGDENNLYVPIPNVSGQIEEALEDYVPIGDIDDPISAISHYGLRNAIIENELVVSKAIIKMNESCGFNSNGEIMISGYSSLTEAILAISARTSSGGGPQVQSDWNESDSASPAFILNKPNLGDYVTSGDVETQITNKNYLPIGSSTDTEDDKTYYGLVDAIEKDEMALTQAILKVSETAGFNSDFEAPELSGKSVVEAILSISGQSVDLSGYYTSAQTNNAISNATSGKQDTLVSGTNIKTINNQSLLGSGNIVIQGGGASGITSGECVGIIESYHYITSANAKTQIEDYHYITSAQAETQITGKNYINSADATTLVEAYGYQTQQDVEDVVNSSLSNYLNSAQTTSAINNAVSGKQNTITDLEGIRTSAGTKSNWNETNTNSPAYIQNKPNLNEYAKSATTLGGYGISDAFINGNVITLGSNSISVTTSGGGDENVITAITVNGTPVPPVNKVVGLSVPTSASIEASGFTKNAPTEASILASGFTKNAGTITGVNMNGASKGTSGVVDLGTVITAETQLSTASTGNGNVLTDITVSNHQITKTMGMTIPTWATASTKPSYSASEVGALPTGTTLDNVGDGTTRKLSDYATNANFTAHTADTTVHVTSTEKGTWNGKQDAISDLTTIRNNAASGASAYTTINAHTANTNIHVEAADKTRWDNAATTAGNAYNNSLSGASAYTMVMASASSWNQGEANVIEGIKYGPNSQALSSVTITDKNAIITPSVVLSTLNYTPVPQQDFNSHTSDNNIHLTSGDVETIINSRFVKISQADYNNLSPKNPNVFYIITGTTA